MIGHAVVQVDQIGDATEITVQTATVGEVGGGHAGDRELVSSTERPEQLLGRLPIQTIDILHRTGGVAVGNVRLRNVPDGRSREREVTVRSRIVRASGNGDGGSTADGLTEPRKHAESQNHHRLVRRKHRTLRKVRGPDVFASDRKKGRVVLNAGNESACGTDQRVTKRLMNSFTNVR